MFMDNQAEAFQINQRTMKIFVGNITISVTDIDGNSNYELSVFSRNGDTLRQPRMVSDFSDITSAVYRAQQMQKF